MGYFDINILFVEKLKVKLFVFCILCVGFRVRYMVGNNDFFMMVCFDGGWKNLMIRFFVREDIKVNIW